MERYQVKLAYDGTDFLGFQRQESSTRTVQAVVEKALQAIGWQGKSILAAGRTDTGVHASGQVISFDLSWNHPVDSLARALNSNLPKDVSVRAVQVVDGAFHPRFDAKRRSYCYRIYGDLMPDPVKRHYVWQMEALPSLTLLNQAANLLPGHYDCAAFGKAPYADGSTIRKIYHAQWKEVGKDEFHFVITANAFLYHMVRRIVYLLVITGRETLTLDALQKGIALEQKLPAGLAPPNGLSLIDVDYESSR